MSGTTIHFRCAFDLRPAEGGLWADIPKQIRSWIASKAEDLGLATKWFLEGGQTEIKGNARQAVVTRREVGSGAPETPQFWSVRYEHPDSEVKFRQWRTEMGLTMLDDGQVRFSLLNRHWIREEYIGHEPDAPLPSAPGIVGRLLRSKLWEGYSGSDRLYAVPVKLEVGQGAAFAQRLENEQRGCPIVLVTRTFAAEKALVDSGRLARLLAGVAQVAETTSAEVNKELEWVLPKGFRCWDGMVRVYQPAVRFERESDARRHRYFTAEDIAGLGSTRVEEMLIVGISRRSGLSTAGVLTTIEDVDAQQRERRLADLRGKAKDVGSLGELVDLLDSDNKALGLKLDTALADATAARETTEKVRDDAATLEHERDNLRGERDYWKGVALGGQVQIKLLEAARSSLDCLGTLPTSLPQVIDVIEKLHGVSIVFSDRARKSAGRATANKSEAGVREAWECLWATATVLPRILLTASGVDPEATFQAATGFHLAMSEGKMTHRDKGLMRLRRDTFEGQDIDITAHVKGAADFRIYFAVDAAKQRLVVGHCGDHLDTAGTRRMD